ncbi:hypothetical protein B0H13DRAFT_1946126 [Mycena leptocephala]|nr:hypothetical protein B0H13DRAFT_1946126 [Mycena leptocephala]
MRGVSGWVWVWGGTLLPRLLEYNSGARPRTRTHSARLPCLHVARRRRHRTPRMLRLRLRLPRIIRIQLQIRRIHARRPPRARRSLRPMCGSLLFLLPPTSARMRIPTPPPTQTQAYLDIQIHIRSPPRRRRRSGLPCISMSMSMSRTPTHREERIRRLPTRAYRRLRSLLRPRLPAPHPPPPRSHRTTIE